MTSAQELFTNVRKSVRLLYEYQKRMQGTMFHIKSILNLSPAGRIEVNKLYSLSPRASKNSGETSLYDSNWAWDYIYSMAMEYHLGEKRLNNTDFCISVLQVTDDGYYRALSQNQSVNRLDTSTYVDAEKSESHFLFVMEIKPSDSSWAKRWNRDKMEENLNKWMVDSRDVIADTTRQGNHFIVMKFPTSQLLNDIAVGKVLTAISEKVEELTGVAIL